MDAVVHYAELGLKGKNRPFFESRLAENLRRLMAPLGNAQVQKQPGRMIASAPQAETWEALRKRLAYGCGVSYFAQVHRTPRDIEPLQKLLARELPSLKFASFACRSRRMHKDYEHTSEQLNRLLGSWVQREFPGRTVDLDTPDLEIFVEVLNREFLVYFRKEEGPGGLPAGVSGKVSLLLSGGIDSPVAGYRMIRRGCRTHYIHFHSMPFTSNASVDKVRELARRLEPWQGPTRLFMVPFGPLQQEIVTGAPAPFRVILYRRFMLRVAEAIAKREEALALVTGESLGQVASQTLQNLTAIDAVSTLPVLRPLIGTDKVDIIREAQRIGTFEVSIQPHDDCCSFLMPRAPATSSTPASAEEAEKGLDVAGLVQKTVAAADTERV